MTTDCSRLLRPGSDEMRDLRSSCELITMNRALHDTIGNGHTLVLTQMFMPRFNEERLQKSALLGGVFEYAPGIGGITAALLGQPFERGQKCFLRVNSIFDRHQHRSSIVLNLVGQSRSGPVHGRSEVEAGTRGDTAVCGAMVGEIAFG